VVDLVVMSLVVQVNRGMAGAIRASPEAAMVEAVMRLPVVALTMVTAGVVTVEMVATLATEVGTAILAPINTWINTVHLEDLSRGLNASMSMSLMPWPKIAAETHTSGSWSITHA
jgi:hypothetical protein